jgi:hypothetical protein
MTTDVTDSKKVAQKSVLNITMDPSEQITSQSRPPTQPLPQAASSFVAVESEPAPPWIEHRAQPGWPASDASFSSRSRMTC